MALGDNDCDNTTAESVDVDVKDISVTWRGCRWTCRYCYTGKWSGRATGMAGRARVKTIRPTHPARRIRHSGRGTVITLSMRVRTRLLVKLEGEFVLCQFKIRLEDALSYINIKFFNNFVLVTENVWAWDFSFLL